MGTVEDDLYLLQEFGQLLDEQVGKQRVRDLLIAALLKIRPKKGGVEFLHLNRVQQEYSRKCSKQNIVLKARQVGITTYIAARFFVQTITRPGTLTVQVAHWPRVGGGDFQRGAALLGEPAQGITKGALVKSRSNVRQIVFPRLDSEYRVETADDNAGRDDHP